MSAYKAFTTEFDQEVHLRDLFETKGVTNASLTKIMAHMSPRIPQAALPAEIDNLTVLMDMSGSMRETPIAATALALIALGDALSASGKNFEFLGFTTSEWKGGKSSAAWREAGRPREPGRLNDLLHVVIKAMDEDWAEARQTVAGLCFREVPILKENIDGEALEWASSRMSSREPSGALLVITDGLPCDDATLAFNHERYLRDHLEQVLDANSHLRIAAVDIGWKPASKDVSPWPNRVHIPFDIDRSVETLAADMLVAAQGQIEVLANLPDAEKAQASAPPGADF